MVELKTSVTKEHLVAMARRCDAILIDAHFNINVELATSPEEGRDAEGAAASGADISVGSSVDTKITLLAGLGLLASLPTAADTGTDTDAGAGAGASGSGGGGGGDGLSAGGLSVGGNGIVGNSGGGGGSGGGGVGPQRHIHVKGAGSPATFTVRTAGSSSFIAES